MGCEVCLPTMRGYTIYFAGEERADLLDGYFNKFDENKWKYVNERMVWAEESVFYDLMDYLEAHYESDQIFAVLSKTKEPLGELHNLRKLASFKEEREAAWIDRVIEESSLCTYYQPIVQVNAGKPEVMGYELLSRGLDVDGSVIPPYKLFEAARVRNRVFSLDRACRMTAVRNARAVEDKLIFINFIPTAIYVPEHCLQATFKLIQEMNIKPEQVVFEVVETDEVKDLDHLKRILNYYRSHGFKYALDDVGTGFNQLDLLQQMEPDVVKLAIEFTNGVAADPLKQDVARSVLKMAHGMSAKALAEGVETEEDLNFLTDMGYDLFQGYYFSKPMDHPVKL
ncbi:EAL domain-containing protein [Peribacillus sp. SCS-37]|uniref:EAL domain-containing protein n=1 Tax=Paraperibacillus esterisolvens TaxID=3115296 RepID=UPI003906556D